MEEPEARFSRLFDAHYGQVLRYAARRVDVDTARDVAAETFLVAWRKRDTMPRLQDDVVPWLYGVARRILSNEHRRERRGQRLLARIAMSIGRDTPAVPDLGSVVGDAVAIVQALRCLKPGDQEVLLLLGWEELTIRQAALVLGCSANAMAVRAHRARRRFLAVLEDQDFVLRDWAASSNRKPS